MVQRFGISNQRDGFSSELSTKYSTKWERLRVGLVSSFCWLTKIFSQNTCIIMSNEQVTKSNRFDKRRIQLFLDKCMRCGSLNAVISMKFLFPILSTSVSFAHRVCGGDESRFADCLRPLHVSGFLGWRPNTRRNHQENVRWEAKKKGETGTGRESCDTPQCSMLSLLLSKMRFCR